MEKSGYTEKQAAEYIGMSRAFLSIDRMNGVRENRTPGPKFVRFGRNIRYLKEHLDAWLDAHQVIEREKPEFLNYDKNHKK